jgi:hypothetical protein
MKEIVTCLREFDGLAEVDQPAYLARMGTGLTAHAGDFPAIVYPGTMCTTHAGTLFLLYSAKDSSVDDMKAYKLELTECKKMVNTNYDGIDNVALGDGDIVAKGGVRGTSQNTGRTAPPSEASNVTFKYSGYAGEILIGWDVDVLASAGIIFSVIDPSIVFEKTGPMQMKITAGDKIIYVDFTTGSKATITNQKKLTEIISTIALFNPNGISPLAVTPPTVIPK